MDFITEYISKLIFCYVKDLDLLLTQDDTHFWVNIIINIIWPILVYLIWKAYLYIVYIRIELDLYPFYDKSAIKYARKYFIQTKCQDSDPSNESEISKNIGRVSREKLIPFFINDVFSKEVDHRYYIVLGDSGMGKSTFLVNLYYDYVTKIRLTKYKIFLFPIGEKLTEDRIKEISISDRKNGILLLDALDEDPQALVDVQARLDGIIDSYHDFRKIVITCRTQFFESIEFEPYETKIRRHGLNEPSYHYFIKKYISPFSPSDIRTYLNKKFGYFDFSRKKKIANQIIENSPDLMVRPMLLSYIDDLIDSDLVGYKSVQSYQIYGVLIEKWIKREAQRLGESNRSDYSSQLKLFTRSVVRKMAENRKLNGLFLTIEELDKIAKENDIHLSPKELKGRSLLNRNSIGQWKFAHKSIFEYLLSVSCFESAVLKMNPMGVVFLFPYEISDLDKFKEFFHMALVNNKDLNRKIITFVNLKNLATIIDRGNDEVFFSIEEIYPYLSEKAKLYNQFGAGNHKFIYQCETGELLSKNGNPISFTLVISKDKDLLQTIFAHDTIFCFDIRSVVTSRSAINIDFISESFSFNSNRPLVIMEEGDFIRSDKTRFFIGQKIPINSFREFFSSDSLTWGDDQLMLPFKNPSLNISKLI